MSEIDQPDDIVARLTDESYCTASDVWHLRLEAAQKIESLQAALVHAVSVIQTWHNMELPVKERSSLWDIYWRNAPEMAPIKAALDD